MKIKFKANQKRSPNEGIKFSLIQKEKKSVILKLQNKKIYDLTKHSKQHHIFCLQMISSLFAHLFN